MCVTNVTKISKLWVDTQNICKLASYRVHCALAVGMKQFDCTVLLLDMCLHGGGKKVHDVIVYTYYIHMYIHICIYKHI